MPLSYDEARRIGANIASYRTWRAGDRLSGYPFAVLGLISGGLAKLSEIAAKELPTEVKRAPAFAPGPTRRNCIRDDRPVAR